MYVNPIPMIDAGKEFILELNVKLDDITEVEHAKLLVAKYLQQLPVDQLANAIRCKRIEPVYPEKVMQSSNDAK